MFIYSMISSSSDHSKRFTLHSLDTSSFRHQLNFSGKHSTTLKLLRENYSLAIPSLPIYQVLIFYNWVNWGVAKRKKMPKLQNSNKGDSNAVSLDWEFSILSVSYRASPSLRWRENVLRRDQTDVTFSFICVSSNIWQSCPWLTFVQPQLEGMLS